MDTLYYMVQALKGILFLLLRYMPPVVLCNYPLCVSLW